MEQPLIPDKASNNDTDDNSNKKRRTPSPQEVIAHYEAQGLDPKEASLKAIAALQTLLFHSVTSAGKNRFSAEAFRKLDNTYLTILEMKVDSKPGFAESLAISVASGTILHSLGSAIPHLTRIWNAVKSANNTSSSSLVIEACLL